MFKKSKFYILITFIFFTNMEINASLWKDRSKEDLFIAMIAQEKDTIQKNNINIFNISGQNNIEKNRCIIEQKKDTFTAIVLFLRNYVLKTVRVLKKWVGAKFSQTFENWRDSLYH
ncbi:hypothetical protein [Bartonella machadoae]|uniref:hypothetical protein n=1 Tax=Bartonella machadoae TaxID=2893471 RepID=UPI001F4D1DDB|nr:hypothetical protein [Bartonella machadoae]UNE54772.1 hypothetical protein LNM86_02515 [Bartonella machadoae]